MRWDKFVFVALLGLVVSSSAFAGDPPQTSNGQANFAVDSSMILPATDQGTRSASADEDHTCLMMRTYRVRKNNIDRSSVIPTAPNQAVFNPDDIVGYSTCQKASKFGVKSTR